MSFFLGLKKRKIMPYKIKTERVKKMVRVVHLNYSTKYMLPSTSTHRITLSNKA